MKDISKRRVVSLIVDNTSGVLARISSLLCRRGFNIDSLTVSATNNQDISRITVSVVGDDEEVRQVLLQTQRLEEVREAFEIDGYDALQRELLLVKVSTDVKNRAELRDIAGIYNSKIIDLSPESMVFELTGDSSKIDAFMTMLKPYKVLEMCRTGVTAMDRGGLKARTLKPTQEPTQEISEM